MGGVGYGVGVGVFQFKLTTTKPGSLTYTQLAGQHRSGARGKAGNQSQALTSSKLCTPHLPPEVSFRNFFLNGTRFLPVRHPISHPPESRVIFATRRGQEDPNKPFLISGAGSGKAIIRLSAIRDYTITDRVRPGPLTPARSLISCLLLKNKPPLVFTEYSDARYGCHNDGPA